MKHEIKFSARTEHVLMMNTRRDKAYPDYYFSGYHILLLCHKGTAHFTMNGLPYALHENGLLAWQLGSEVSEVSYSDDFDADFLCMSRAIIIKYNPDRVWASRVFLYIRSHPIIYLDSNAWALCTNNFNMIRQRLPGSGHVFIEQIIGVRLRLLLYDLWHIYTPKLDDKVECLSSASSIFRSFILMLSEYAVTERRLSFYAKRLCVSAKYLSQISRTCSGRPATNWIAGYAIQELQRLLQNPAFSLNEICHQMCFANYPSFAKYAKSGLGMSPSAYRRQIENRAKK